MSQDEQKYGFFAKKDSPFQQILESIKALSGQSFRVVIEDILLLHRYPYFLRDQGASTEQVVRQAEESIRRLNIEITALTALITSMPRDSKSDPIIQTPSASAITTKEKPKAKAGEPKEEKGQSLYVSDHF